MLFRSAGDKKCIHHPNATSHTTEECRTRGKATDEAKKGPREGGAPAAAGPDPKLGEMKCFHCHELGHLRTRCPKLKQQHEAHFVTWPEPFIYVDDPPPLIDPQDSYDDDEDEDDDEVPALIGPDSDDDDDEDEDGDYMKIKDKGDYIVPHSDYHTNVDTTTDDDEDMMSEDEGVPAPITPDSDDNEEDLEDVPELEDAPDDSDDEQDCEDLETWRKFGERKKMTNTNLKVPEIYMVDNDVGSANDVAMTGLETTFTVDSAASISIVKNGEVLKNY